MASAKIRNKGQITLPLEIRRELNLEEGDVIYFDRRGDDIVISSAKDIIKRTAGIFAEYAKDGPVEIDRDKIWGEIAEERDNRIKRQVAEESGKYDPN